MEKNERKAWIHAIKRKNWKPQSWERVCGRHFVSGRPTHNKNDVDYSPTLFMSTVVDLASSTSLENASSSVKRKVARSERSVKRNERSHAADISEVRMFKV